MTRVMCSVRVALAMALASALAGSPSSADQSQDFAVIISDYLPIKVSAVLRANVMLECYVAGYERLVEHDAPRCGLLRVANKDMMEISYSYIPGFAYYSVWLPENDAFVAGSIDVDTIERFVTSFEKDENSGEPGPLHLYSLEERLKLYVIWAAFVDYVEYLLALSALMHEYGMG